MPMKTWQIKQSKAKICLCVRVYIYIYTYQLIGELNSSQLVTGILARTAATKNTYALESGGFGGLQRLGLVVVFHKENLAVYFFSSVWMLQTQACGTF